MCRYECVTCYCTSAAHAQKTNAHEGFIRCIVFFFNIVKVQDSRFLLSYLLEIIKSFCCQCCVSVYTLSDINSINFPEKSN